MAPETAGLPTVRHSPLPWKAQKSRDSSWFIVDSDSTVIARCDTPTSYEEDEGNAALIVEAVNHHAELQAERFQLLRNVAALANQRDHASQRAEQAEAQLTEAVQLLKESKRLIVYGETWQRIVKFLAGLGGAGTVKETNLTMVCFATLCDGCDNRSAEYTQYPTCRGCGNHVCKQCAQPGSIDDNTDGYVTALCADCEDDDLTHEERVAR